MREFKIAMMLVMAVILAPAALAKTNETSNQTSHPERVILSFPQIERETNSEQVSKQHAQSDRQSAGVTASRSGIPTAKPAYSEEDLFWLSRIISAEASGESMEGQIAVGAVIMNRVHHPRFPKTVKEVIFVNGQFDPVRDGRIYQAPVPSAIEAAKRVLQGENPLPEAFYFYNPNTATDTWIRTLRVITRIGNHVFAASS
jgi:N-acetylmuramoyl-L-alanine amidase